MLSIFSFIRFGNGSVVGENVMGLFPDEQMFVVNSMSVTTSRGIRGRWQIHADMSKLCTPLDTICVISN